MEKTVNNAGTKNTAVPFVYQCGLSGYLNGKHGLEMSRHCGAAKILLTICIYILANEMDINDSGCRAENTSCNLTGSQTPVPGGGEALMHIHVFAEQMYKYTLRVSSNFKTSYKYQFRMIN